MSADFWAGYLSGAIGIIIGNPLDVLKVRLQSSPSTPPPPPPPPLPTATLPYLTSPTHLPRPPVPLLKTFLTGTAAPLLGYGALNALLFVSYNRSLLLLSPDPSTPPPLTHVFLAGTLSGLATFSLSTPTELIKCRAQLSSSRRSSWHVARETFRAEGVRGFYKGGAVTAWRDAVGYGFYFWGYEGVRRMGLGGEGGMGVFVAGGVAGVVTWGSVFPVDVVKTRVQTTGKGVREVVREVWREGGWRGFWRGFGVCSARAFVVNAVQWGVYEWVMGELGEGKKMGGVKGEGVLV